jgi:hypothetical protein
VRSVVEEALALGQVLVDEPELALLEVADAAVDHLGGLRRRARREVRLLDEGRLQPPACCVEGNPGAGHAAADDEDVELLVGQSRQPVGSVEGAHRPRATLSKEPAESRMAPP